MKNYFKYLFFLAPVLFFSCEKELEFKGDQLAPKLVVNSFLENDKPILLNVYGSVPIPGIEQTIKEIKDANVTLFVDGIETEHLKYKMPDSTYIESWERYIYTSTDKGYRSETIKAEIGKKYRIEVSYPGYKSVWCETIIPEPVAIEQLDTIRRKVNYNWGHSESKLFVMIHFTDPAGVTNYYRINGAILKGKISYNYNSPDPTSDYTIVRSYEQYPIYSEDKLIGGGDNADELLFGSGYNYHNLFNDELINGKKYILETNGNSWAFNNAYFQELDTTKGEFIALEINLHSLNSEAYWYLKSLGMADDNSEMEFMREPVPVFSNINNGVGIFAGTSVYKAIILISGQYPKPGVRYTDEAKIYIN